MLKRIGLVALVLVVFALMIWFTSLNPDVVSIDLAFVTVEPTVALALTVTLALGWVLGVLCTGVYVLRLLNERRRLRNELDSTRSEVSSLRNLPIADAD